MSRAKTTRKRPRPVLRLAAPPMEPSRSQPPEAGPPPCLHRLSATDSRSNLWLREIRDDLLDIPLHLAAAVLALGLLAGILVKWIGGD